MYLREQEVSNEHRLSLKQLLYLLRITTCPNLLRNHAFLVLGHLALLAPEVREQIAALASQGTNSTAFKKKFGAMPQTNALLKNLRSVLPRYGVEVTLTPEGEHEFKNVNEVIRSIWERENLVIWTCQYLILLNSMVFSSKWSHERKFDAGKSDADKRNQKRRKLNSG